MIERETSTIQTRGPGVLGLLGVAFVILKLMGYIDWSWWWVTLPFWVGLAIFLVIFIVVFLFAVFFKRF